MRVVSALKLEDASSAITPLNFATRAKLLKWDSEFTGCYWQTHWTKKGLQIIQPRVYSCMDIVLPPGSALELVGVQ